MEFDQLVTTVTEFFHAHMFISLVGLAIVASLLYESPKKTLKFLAIFAVLAVAAYFFVQKGKSSDMGVGAKEELTNKTKKAIGE